LPSPEDDPVEAAWPPADFAASVRPDPPDSPDPPAPVDPPDSPDPRAPADPPGNDPWPVPFELLA